MRLYLTLFAYTPEALARLAKDPQDRSAAVREMVEVTGGKLHAFYHSYGEYHGAVITEVPDDITNTAISWAVESAGHLKAYKTIPLLTIEDSMQAMRKAGESAFRGPGRQ